MSLFTRFFASLLAFAGFTPSGAAPADRIASAAAAQAALIAASGAVGGFRASAF
jgi:hypothetical protein